MGGLHDALRSGRPDRLNPALEAKIIAVTQQPPPRPYTHWSVRGLAHRLGVSRATVHRVWQRAGLKPYRLEHYTASSDPDFERKAADILGLYLHPPALVRHHGGEAHLLLYPAGGCRMRGEPA